MKVAVDTVYEIMDGTQKDWKVISDNITDQDRWSTYWKYIVFHISENKYYSFIYSRGSTEEQDYSSFEEETEIEFTELKKHTTLIIDWFTEKEYEKIVEKEDEILKDTSLEDRNRILNEIK